MFGGLRLHPCSSLPLTALPFACRSMDKLGERSSCPAVSRSYSSIRARLRDILISSRSSLLPEHAAHAFGPPHLTPTFPQVTFVYTVSRRLVVKHNWQCGGACCAEGARLAAGTRSMGCGKAGRAGWGRMEVFVRRDGAWLGAVVAPESRWRCWCCFQDKLLWRAHVSARFCLNCGVRPSFFRLHTRTPTEQHGCVLCVVRRARCEARDCPERV